MTPTTVTTGAVQALAALAESTSDTPLEGGRAMLQRALSARHEAEYGPAGGEHALPAPLVVPLGAADTLGFGHRDPYAAIRPTATVHLTSRAVLIGPW